MTGFFWISFVFHLGFSFEFHLGFGQGLNLGFFTVSFRVSYWDFFRGSLGFI